MYSATLLFIRTLIFGFFLGVFVVPTLAYAERIRSFDADIALAPDGSFSVTETIVYDFEDTERHGIFRTLPSTHPEPASAWYRSRYVDIDIASVSLDGAPAPYTTDASGDTYEVRIGDPERTLSGEHTYTVSYAVRGALFFGSDAPELYWNVTGDGWTVPIDSVVASVSAPEGMLAEASACYVGTSGSTETCAATSTAMYVTFSAEELASGEGMTIAHELVPGSVDFMVNEQMSHSLITLFLVITLMVALSGYAYRVATRHKIRVTEIVQYEPYEGALPMYAGVLIDGRLNSRDIAAGIVYLAEQGFLSIKHIEKSFLGLVSHDYRVVLRRPITEAPGVFLPQVLKLLFGDTTRTGQSVVLSDIKHDQSRRNLNHKILRALKKALREDMRKEGYFELSFPGRPSQYWILCGTGLVLLAGVIGAFISPVYFIFALALFILAVVCIVLVWHRRTQKGYEAKNHLRGFRKFLSVTDRERFAFHNAPAKSPEVFMRYLPYAIAFGVETEWAKVFRNIALPPPNWYYGGVDTFSAATFANDMHAFSDALSASAGTSASSGGGSSGGGAGGGGGGSW